MPGHRSWRKPDADGAQARRQTKALAGVVIVLLLLIAGLFVIRQLRTAARIEDCLMAGRRDCDALVPQGGGGAERP